MPKDQHLLSAAIGALNTFGVWQDADDTFPDPEYDNFVFAMDKLRVVLSENYGINVDTSDYDLPEHVVGV
jgi:hypothetical protein